MKSAICHSTCTGKWDHQSATVIKGSCHRLQWGQNIIFSNMVHTAEQILKCISVKKRKWIIPDLFAMIYQYSQFIVM